MGQGSNMIKAIKDVGLTVKTQTDNDQIQYVETAARSDHEFISDEEFSAFTL